MVGPAEPLALTRQCELAGVNRSTGYAPHIAAKPDKQALTLLDGWPAIFRLASRVPVSPAVVARILP